MSPTVVAPTPLGPPWWWSAVEAHMTDHIGSLAATLRSSEAVADIVLGNGNPLDDVTVRLDPARIKLVLKGGAICADRRSPSPR